MIYVYPSVEKKYDSKVLTVCAKNTYQGGEYNKKVMTKDFELGT